MGQQTNKKGGSAFGSGFANYSMGTSQPEQKSGFGSFSMPGQSNQGFGSLNRPGLGQAASASFSAVELFKTSFAEVTQPQKDSKKKQLYSNAAASRMPDRQYLNTKRSSVFHKAFDSNAKVEKFVPPIFQKSEQDIRSLTELFATSFLSKHLDSE